MAAIGVSQAHLTIAKRHALRGHGRSYMRQIPKNRGHGRFY